MGNLSRVCFLTTWSQLDCLEDIHQAYQKPNLSFRGPTEVYTVFAVWEW